MEIMRFFYQRRCPVCEEILPDLPGKNNRNVCLKCNVKLHYIGTPRCLKCGKQIYSMNEEYCSDCQNKAHLFKQGISVFAYDEKIKQTMYRFKYSNRREYAEFFGSAIAQRHGCLIRRWKPQVIIPVPLYKIKYRKRGYNQAGLIADVLGRNLNIPVEHKILIRTRMTRAMKELNDEERVKNLQNAFKLTTNIVEYKKVLLVDDIYTTGATIDACCEALIAGGAEEIYFASACIGNGF